jgi:hypothetical protein
VGLVEQPQLRAAGGYDGEGRTAALAGRQSVDGHGGQPTAHTQAVHGRGDLGVGGAHGATPEADVLGDGQILVEAVAVAQHPDLGATSWRRDRVATQYDGLPAVTSGGRDPQGWSCPRLAAGAMEDPRTLLINLILFGLLPLWGIAGFIDWCCHRATKVNDRLHETVSRYLRGSG